jgi:UDP-2-acetamido-3-amino-2,3-dideoxy-glucuronate N-acetyltransferase
MSGHFVHETSWVDAGVSIGAGTKIWFFCHVQRGSVLGERCILGQNVNIDSDVVIGNGVKIQNNVSVYKGVHIDDDVFLGPSCVFTNVINPRAHVERKAEFKPTHVGRGATVGANSTIVCGNQLGAYCMVGAGAVVTSDVPAHALVVGVPARQVGWVCACGERLALDGGRSSCSACGATYVLADGALTRTEEE